MNMINAEDLVKSAISEMTGITFEIPDPDNPGQTITTPAVLADLSSYNIVDIGKLIVGGTVPTGTTESFFKAMISVVGRIDAENRLYSGDLNVFMIRDFEWGGFLERMYFGIGDVLDDPKYNLMRNYAGGKTDYAAEDLGFYPAPVKAAIFDEGKPLVTPISKPMDQIKEAFRGPEQMASFIAGISALVENTLTVAIQSVRHMMAQNAIAISMSTLTTQEGTTRPATAVNLATLFNANAATPITTADEALTREDFLIFALQTIAEVRDNLTTFNTAFNDGTVPVFTDYDDSRLVLLNKFDKACRFMVKANTFNREDLAIGDYSTTTAWQAFMATGGTAFDFDAVGGVKIAADSTNKLGIGTSAFSASGVVGLLFDRRALAICPYKRQVTGKYVAIGDYYNEFHRVLLNCILDTRAPIVAFYIAP